MRPSRDALAHLARDGRSRRLRDHLEAVAEAAARFAEAFGAAEIARLTGLWHDLGKYANGFQFLIREEDVGFDAHIEGDATGPRDHSSAGAILATQTPGSAGTLIAFAIAGHHAGLANQNALAERLQRKAEGEDRYLERAKSGGAPSDLLTAAVPPLPEHLRGFTVNHIRRSELWTRMLFSALCDADFLDAEAFYRGDLTPPRERPPPLDDLSARLEAHVAELEALAPATEVNRVRAEVHAACLAAAGEEPGFFSLTAPTGSGKTLAALTFALAHAKHHGLARVVTALPFTSIIEPTAQAYREALKTKGAVLEHHSGLEPNRETVQNRIAPENWDAPVIVTTTEQLLESLFSNRPGPCRKLHRLARSVIVLDEAQTLPVGMLAPILDVLRTLVHDFGASIVISTATMPILGRSSWLEAGFEDVYEIIPAAVRAPERLRRARVRWPNSNTAVSHDELAEEIAQESEVLAIVHRREDARLLTTALDRRLGDASTLHLSALMCAEHRATVLAEAQRRRQRGEPVRLVSTQIVEGGADLDFPVVYRALGGFDVIALAAGRCNREGRLAAPGEVRVFVAPTSPPRGVRELGLDIARRLIRNDPDPDLAARATFAPYFQELYAGRNLDVENLQEARAALDFKDIAKAFKIIEDYWSSPIVVPYGDEAAARIDAIELFGPTRERLRAVQRLTVNVKRAFRERWIQRGYARWVQDTIVVLDEKFARAYHDRFGLIPDQVGR